MTSDQLELLELQRASATGPATGEQLEQWAAEHDRVWDRKVRTRRVLFGSALIGLVGLAVFAGGRWKNSDGFLAAFACAWTGVMLWRFYTSPVNERPMNPYRPIKVTHADLQERNAAFPVALAYLDAIRHQRRPIVPHDLGVLGMIRRQQQFNPGA
ncbi:hypothetical protein [Burkholderia cenocepacia]|uniref:hypothetical protein n=1 Tax=Burkholderia cenocepacia TaxID=95486 RepID=UPI002B24556C|nr:hypothetical protein [Burkholderia cenocepacia]MEB2558780.1 hypothetical protein [Burkholderia cenocepacia]